MPLPASGTPWPPKQLAPITSRLAEWSAWYSGDPAALRSVYQRATAAAFRPADRPAQYRGGVVGAVARMWWGRPVSDLSTRVDQVHVPIAADLCQASADLLYAEPPQLTVDDKATQERLNTYLDDGLHTVLASGAEVGAALGGRYHRVTWDRALLPDRPFLTTVDADAAWPTFRFDRLVAVTFWYVLPTRDAHRVLRHLERHELDEQGNGVILHGLYDGTPDDLGRPIPLTEHADTEGLAAVIDADGAVVGPRTPGLCVEYVPNQRPQRRWRSDPVGRSLGRSDLDGVEGLMDALDETYSSWMRDIRLSKARIHVPEHMLEAGTPGQGSSFDLDRDVYVGLPGLLQTRDAAGNLPIQAQQFAIRTDDFQRTCQDLVEQILRSAGYSAQTFGEGPDGAAVTATEVQSRERRSFMTRDRKVRLERPAVTRLVTKMLTVDAAVFGAGGLNPEGLAVSFGDSVQDSPLSLAQTAQALESAKAASTRTKVRMMHPDWDDEQVTEEVDLITAEHAITLADPTTTVPPGAETPTLDPAAIKAKADAMGVLIRAGVKPEDAADQVGLSGVEFTGAVPTSLRLPEAEAASLEQA